MLISTHKGCPEVGLEAENTELQTLVKEWRIWYAKSDSDLVQVVRVVVVQVMQVGWWVSTFCLARNKIPNAITTHGLLK